MPRDSLMISGIQHFAFCPRQWALIHLEQHWQEKKRDEITHPFLKGKIPWCLVSHMQALLLARCIRGDVEEYPPFLWK